MRFCKYCDSQIFEGAVQCPKCGKDLTKPIESPDRQKMSKMPFSRWPQESKKSKITPLLFITSILILAAIFAISNTGKCKVKGCDNKAISSMDYCYMHKCAVADCNNKRFGCSNYCHSHYFLYDDDASSVSTPQVYSYELKISHVTLSSNSSYTIAEGTITNNSNQTVSFVKIKGSFENSSETVVDTDWTYAVGSEGLAPGESCKWRMSVKKDYLINDCTVSILDFEY